MKVTIVDIARIAGVSQATVSRVLNTPDLVRESTRNKVLRAMEEHNYVYNALAGGLGKNRTRTLGLIIPTINNPVFAVSTQAIQVGAAQLGYSILLGTTEYTAALEFDLIRLYAEKQVDGIVLTGSPQDPRSIEYLRTRKIPFVVIWEKPDEEHVSYVTFDNAQAALRGVEYLISMGHKRIGMIAGQFAVSGRARRRWEGYRQGLLQAGLTYDEHLVSQREYTVIAGQEAASGLLRQENPPTAIFCGNDLLAYGAIVAVRQQGLRVGKDVSIIGFDDLEISVTTDPPLTTIRVPGEDMGKRAAAVLIDHIEHKSTGPVHYTLETDLIVRQSVANLHS